MDDSRIYRNMSKKALEIQDNHEPEVGDYYIDMGDLWILRPNNPKTLCTVTPAYVKKHKKNDIWLPRQDQLQEMAEYRSIGKNLELLSEFWNTKYCYDNFTTMEQLWLAFVMSEKYSKKWIDDEWKEM